VHALRGCLALLWLFAGGCSEASAPLRPPTTDEALAGLPTRDPIELSLRTSEGDVQCALSRASAPHAVALFVGLARGRATWRDPSGARVQRPMYRDMPFFRAIPNALVQSGCPIGNGTGHPGYRLPVESAPDDATRLGRPGVLFLARYRPAPNRVDPAPPPAGHVIGSQFVIGLADFGHLAGQVSVIGACRDLERVRAIAARVARRQPVQLRDVRFAGAPKEP
jgi:peptidyl-prolyl cis-trans isomerase A (cyclophilin A)